MKHINILGDEDMKENDYHGETQYFVLENLGCANCAAKMEKKIKELPEVKQATITFTTKQLRIVTSSTKNLLAELQRICSSIESDVVVKSKETKQTKKTDDTDEKLKQRRVVLEIIIGAALFAVGIIFKNLNINITVYIFVVAYIVLGRKIVWIALKNIVKGHVFDENFLMSLATIAAFAIGDVAEAVGVMLFYRVGELFEDIAVERSRSQIMGAIDMRPEVVNLVETDTDKVVIIPAQNAKTGDIVLIRPGDRIPLDGVIIDGVSRLDTSPITGEPIPIKVSVGDSILSGCVNTSGLLKMKVEKVLADSMVSRILDSVENAAANKPKMDRFITKFARIYTPVVVGIALITAIVPSVITGNWNHWIYTAITFLVISCPCALVLSVPLAFFSGIGAGSKRGILFKGGAAIEALNNVKAVVMDKTGTITAGNFVVQDSVAVSNYTKEQVLCFAASSEMTSTHPIGNSIVVAAKEKRLAINRPTSVNEIAGNGIQAVLAEGEVLCGNLKLMEAYKVEVSQHKSANYGTEVFVALDRKLIGYIIISDTLKKDAATAIGAIKKFGIRTAMLTGDAISSAKSVATQAGVEEVYAKLLPEDKVQKLADIRATYGPVMFVGDGINDAPVLAGADVGAAMGNGADAAIEAADVVFMASSMEAIPQSLVIARATNKIAKQNVIFALSIKALVMVLGFAGFANMWMAVFADTGVAMLCVLNSIRILYKKEWIV